MCVCERERESKLVFYAQRERERERERLFVSKAGLTVLKTEITKLAGLPSKNCVRQNWKFSGTGRIDRQAA